MNPKKTSLHAFFCSTLFFLIFSGVYATALAVNESQSSFKPITDAYYFVDPSNKLTLEQIESKNIQNQFKPISTLDKEINFGFSSATYWVRLVLSRQAFESSAWILEIPYTGLDLIRFYAPDKTITETGGQSPIQSRPIFNRFYAFPIVLNENSEVFYFEIRSNAPISLPLNLMTVEQYGISTQKDTIFQFLYFGGIATLCIFNLFLFLYLRDRLYLLYFLFAGFLGLGNFAGNGYGRLYMWPNHPNWDAISMAFFISCAAGSAWLFTNQFLNTKKYLPKIEISLNVIAILSFLYGLWIVIFAAFNFSPAIPLEVFPLLTMLGCFLTIYAAFKVSLLGDQSARIFLVAWGVLCVGGIVASLRTFNLLPSNGFTMYAVQISSAFEMLFLAFALANRIKGERRMREYAQNEALKSKEALVETLKASEERLEALVTVRTNDLRDLLENEKKMRAQYVRFGSMISHEFRNPLGIIETQLALLERDKDGKKLPKRISTIGSAVHRLAILFDRWLQGDRWNSKMDEINPRAIDLNHWLLNITEQCQNYHPSHKFMLMPNPAVPIIRADEKMLQVAVLNLIDNACKFSPDASQVTISIKQETDMVGICVSDQGQGIDPAHHQSIYEEYYQINYDQQIRGLGLGLSFVKKIITMHGGRIDLVSGSGKGASFTIWFPI